MHLLQGNARIREWLGKDLLAYLALCFLPVEEIGQLVFRVSQHGSVCLAHSSTEIICVDSVKYDP